MLTERKLQANRLNAQKSTGPRTEEGKQRSSLNATTHGIYCRDVVLEFENKELFLAIREDYVRRLNPQDALELSFVDRVVEAQWKLNRLQTAELKLYEFRESSLRDILDRRRRGELDVRDEHAWEKIDKVIDPMSDQHFASYMSALGLGHCTLTSLLSDDNPEIERYQKLRSRLELSISRALRELRTLKALPKHQREEVRSPYAADAEEKLAEEIARLAADDEDDDDDENCENEPTESTEVDADQEQTPVSERSEEPDECPEMPENAPECPGDLQKCENEPTAPNPERLVVAAAQARLD